MRNPDPRIDEAKALPVGEIADRLCIAGLKPAGRERVGPCPVCGGSDRFSIAPDRGVFNCRQCGGGDGIRLVELVLGKAFLEAVTWLVGDRPADLDPAEAARRRAKAQKAEAERAAVAEKKRAEAIAAARAIWRACEPPEDTPVRAYLERRGLTRERMPRIPGALRYHPALRFTHMIDGEWRTIHEGPAMVAGVADVTGKFIGAHRTWIDLATDNGKAAIAHAGEALPSKKMLGSKKGGAIRFSPAQDARRTLIMGEGIETTLSAMVAAPVPGAAYWAGVDLGNMAGRRLVVTNSATGKRSSRFSELPDLEDHEAFRPPSDIRRLIFIQDGDSAARETRAKLLAGLARARHCLPGLVTELVHAGDGIDLNDLLRRPSP